MSGGEWEGCRRTDDGKIRCSVPRVGTLQSTGRRSQGTHDLDIVVSDIVATQPWFSRGSPGQREDLSKAASTAGQQHACGVEPRADRRAVRT